MADLQVGGSALTDTDRSDIRTGLGLGNSATRSVGTTAGTVAAGDDSRLSNARTPTAHAASHAAGESDAITPASIGAATAAQGTDSREWTAATVDQAEAEAGSATTRRAWTALRVRQAIAAWWSATASTLIKTVNGNSLIGSGDLAVTASPAGSDTQLQFNDAGTAAGTAGLTWNKTTNTLTVASGTQTASVPIQALTQTWNAGGVAFTGWGLNITDSASSAFSLLANFQVGGVTQFSVRKDGMVLLNSRNSPSVFVGMAGSTGLSSTLLFITGTGGTAGSARMTGAQTGLHTAGLFGFTSNANSSDSDLLLHRIAAGVIGQYNGANAQEHQWYGTRTDAGNYRRVSLGMSTAGVGHIRPEGLGSGASGNVLHISGLPTSNPGPGILWNDAGTVKVGT